MARICKVADKVPTPFYYYDSSIMQNRYEELKNSLPRNWNIYFAVKANPNVALLNLYKNLGATAEASSAGEMMATFKAGFHPSSVALSGPVKTDREFSILKEKSLAIIHVESEDELLKIDSLGIKQSVALRINPDFSVGSSSGEVMIGGREKFGFSTKDATAILKSQSRYKNIDFKGFHIYMGTQILSASGWVKGAGNFLKWVEKVSKDISFTTSYLNFGGGLGIPYMKNQKEFDLKTFEAGLKKLQQRIDKSDIFAGDIDISIEPGRYLAGPAGVYLMKVEGVKKIRNRQYILTDGGIHHALFPFRLSKQYPVKIINRKASGKKTKYILGGPLCTTLDQCDMPIELPTVKKGDILGIYQSGSYGYSASMSYFLSHPLPAEVIDDGTDVKMIRKESEIDHIFVNQIEKRIGI